MPAAADRSRLIAASRTVAFARAAGRSACVGDRDDDLQVALELRLRAAGPDDHAGAAVERVAQAVGGRQRVRALRQVLGRGDRQAAEGGRRLRAQPAHRVGDQRQVLDADRELVGGVQAVLHGEVVQQVGEGAALAP